MIAECTPSVLSGTIRSISSKSHAHRVLICAALSTKPTRIYCNVMSKDIAATVACLKAMGDNQMAMTGDHAKMFERMPHNLHLKKISTVERSTVLIIEQSYL